MNHHLENLTTYEYPYAEEISKDYGILLNYPAPEYFQNNFQKPTTEIFLRPKLAHYANYFAINNMKCLQRTLRILELLVQSTVG